MLVPTPAIIGSDGVMEVRRADHSVVRLPPVVFVGVRALRPVPNNAPLTRLGRSPDPMSRIVLRHEDALQRRAIVAKHLRKGVVGLHGILGHSTHIGALPEHDAQLQLHVGVRSTSHAQRPGLDFLDATLLGTTSRGGMMTTEHLLWRQHQHDALRGMMPLHILDLGLEDPDRPKDSVDCQSGTQKTTQVEDVMFARELMPRAKEGGEAYSSVAVRAQGSQHYSSRRRHRRDAPPLKLESNDASRGEVLALTSSSTLQHGIRAVKTVTLAKRYSDKDKNFAPKSHQLFIPTEIDVKQSLKRLRNRTRVLPPPEVAEEFYRASALRCDANTSAMAPLPVSIELAYEHMQSRSRSSVALQHTIGGGTQQLLKETFSLCQRAKVDKVRSSSTPPFTYVSQPLSSTTVTPTTTTAPTLNGPHGLDVHVGESRGAVKTATHDGTALVDLAPPSSNFGMFAFSSNIPTGGAGGNGQL